MKALILVGLLFLNLTLFGQDSLHCIPLNESRVVHELALKSLSLDSMLQNREGKIIILEDKSATREKDFAELLGIQKQKDIYFREITDHLNSLVESYKSEAKENRWQATKFKILAVLEGIALAALIIIAL